MILIYLKEKTTKRVYEEIPFFSKFKMSPSLDVTEMFVLPKIVSFFRLVNVGWFYLFSLVT